MATKKKNQTNNSKPKISQQRIEKTGDKGNREILLCLTSGIYCLSLYWVIDNFALFKAPGSNPPANLFEQTMIAFALSYLASVFVIYLCPSK